MSELSEAELELLLAVRAERVGISRGRYLLLERGQPDAPPEIFTLRARGLVVLARVTPGRRVPPTQLCVTTPKADAILKEMADA
jgi:hypothetical protein